MKHLGNCAPGEFMARAGAIRGPFIEWSKAVDVEGLRARYLGALPKDAGAEARRAARGEYLCAVADAALDNCPELTRELLCLATFTEPERFEARPMAAYLKAAMEMYSDGAIRDFFTYWPGQGRGTGSRP